MYISPYFGYRLWKDTAKASNRAQRQRLFAKLLRQSHAVNTATIDGIDAIPLELHARAVSVMRDEAGDPESAIKVAGLSGADHRNTVMRVASALLSVGITSLDVQIRAAVHPSAVNPDSALDLPLALVVLAADGDIPPFDPGEWFVFGELDAAGLVRDTPGAVALALKARPGQKILCPVGNTYDAMLAHAYQKGVSVHPVSNLDEAIGAITGQLEIPAVSPKDCKYRGVQTERSFDFSLLRGNPEVKRAMVIAASGSHNLLMSGPPGCGKSMAVKCLASILPDLSRQEVVELTKVYQLSGEISSGQVVNRRPVRFVNQTVSLQGLTGGGNSKYLKPGDITLAHNGVLFLDEIPEFSKRLLDALRQPIEDGFVALSRVHRHEKYPCRFMFVAAQNACPCGNLGWPGRECVCTANQIDKYNAKISGPIYDRIDLKVTMMPLESGEELDKPPTHKESPDMKAQVDAARSIQSERFADEPDIHCNAHIPPGLFSQFCQFSDDAAEEYRKAGEVHELTNRGRERVAKVSRTIADLDVSELIEVRHVEEAIGFMV